MTTTPAEVVAPDEESHRVSVPVIWAGIAALVVGLVAGFFIGRGTATSEPSSLADALTQAVHGSLPRGDVAGALQKSGGLRAVLGTGVGGGGAGTGGAGGGRFGVAGTVSSINGNTITITTNAGTVKVIISGTTTYQKSVAATQADVTAGERVTVRPDFTTRSSGSQVNAGTVVIQPATATPTRQ